MSYDQDLDKFAGTSRHWTHFDEEPPKPIFVECLARLVDTNGDFWITMTPVEGMNWIYDDLYEKNVNNPEGDVEVIEINTLENPYLSAEGIQSLVNSMDEDDVTTRIGGGYVQQGGRVYKNFDPTTGFTHVLSDSIRDPKTYFPERNWMWILSLDHGLNNPTAVYWTAVNDDGFCVIFDEWYRAELSVEQHAEVIKRKIADHGRFPDLLVADPALGQRNAVSMTNIQQEYQKYGLSFIMGNNDVKAGIIRVKKYLNRHEYPRPVGRRHPIYGGTAIPEMSSDSVKVKSPDGKYPKILIDPKCEKLIWEMKRYRWKTYSDKKKQYENNPYDEPHKKDDHGCDSIRYMIMTRPDLVANSNDVNKEVVSEAMQALDKKMAQAGAWEIDDPRGVLTNSGFGNGQWNPTHTMPTETQWDIDEHMGGNF